MKIGLITILTNNIESMKGFYSNVLGFKILEDLGSYVEYDNEGVRFALCTRKVMKIHTAHESYSHNSTGQSFELALPAGSPENVDKLYNEIVHNGATPIKAPEMMPWGRKTGFIADPDGNIHEIYSEKSE